MNLQEGQGIQIDIEGCVSEMGLRKDLHCFHHLFAISTFCLKHKMLTKLFKSGETGWQSGHLREDKNRVDDMGRIYSWSVYSGFDIVVLGSYSERVFYGFNGWVQRDS